MKLRWFDCYVPTLDVEVLTEATSHGKARYKTLLKAWEAGYRKLTFKDVKVRLSK